MLNTIALIKGASYGIQAWSSWRFTVQLNTNVPIWVVLLNAKMLLL